MKQHYAIDGITVGVRGHNVDPARHPANDPPSPPAPNPNPDDDPVRQARYEAEQARAEAARLKKELEEMKGRLPTDEERAKLKELETAAARAEEERLKKAGEFDNWRRQIEDKHAKELEAEREMARNADGARKQVDQELDDTLIGREFADASELFGPSGRTVLMPDIAQSYFARHVSVETVANVNGPGHKRRVIVKDANGTVILDPKTGKPAEFGKAMSELIDAHPRKDQMLRNSGKVGAGSPGGAHGNGGLDLNNLKAKDFQNPAVRDAVREKQTVAGGLQMGPAFDRMRQKK